MIDEDHLTRALSALGDRLSPPEGGRAAIVTAARSDLAPLHPSGGGPARGGPTRNGRRRRMFWPPTGRQLAAAACVVVMAAALSAGLLGLANRTGGGASSSVAHQPVAAGPAGSPSTTAASASAIGSASSGKSSAAAGSSSSSSGPTLAGTGVDQPTKVVETGSIDLGYAKGDFDHVVNQLAALATGSGGYVASEQTSRSGAVPTGSVTLRVPVARFQTVLHQAEHLGHVRSETTSGQDVTSRYVDLTARIKALQATRDQLTTILAKAKTIPDILAVQNQLTSTQSEIEQLQGEQKLLADQAALSTLAVSLYQQDGPAAVAPSPGGLGGAWHQAVSGFVGGFETVLSGSGTVVLALLALAVSLAIIIALGRLGWAAVHRRLL